VKTFLFKLSEPPYSGTTLHENLDIILTIAAFDQDVSLLFIDDGVFQLKKNQLTDSQGLKNTLPIFNALPLYDIQSFYVEIESLDERGLSLAEMAFPMTPIPRREISALMKRFSIVY
jgi:tRNA 2-thiouridine synthesizing protein C